MKKGLRLLLRVAVFISCFLIADFLFFDSSSSSLLSSNTSEEDDLHNTQEWQEMGVIPKDYIIPHQLTTGAGGVPGGSLAETAASDEEEDYEGFGVANPDGSEKKSSADQGDDQEVKSSVYAPLVVEKTVIKADKSKMEEANRFAEQQRVPSEASKNRKKKAAKEKEEKEKEEKEKAEAAALKEELAGDGSDENSILTFCNLLICILCRF